MPFHLWSYILFFMTREGSEDRKLLDKKEEIKKKGND